MVPVVAPFGTDVTIWLTVDEVTVAIVLLNLTVFWLGVALNPVPEMVTIVPIGPFAGAKVRTDVCDEVKRVMDTTFPTAS